jgi:hypothetical protein
MVSVEHHHVKVEVVVGLRRIVKIQTAQVGMRT